MFCFVNLRIKHKSLFFGSVKFLFDPGHVTPCRNNFQALNLKFISVHIEYVDKAIKLSQKKSKINKFIK